MSKLLAQTANIGSIQPVTDARTPQLTGNAQNVNQSFINSLETYVSDIIGVITILAALFFIVYAFTAGFEWVTAGGDSGKVGKARDRLLWSTLGLVLIVAAYSIIGLIGSLVGLNLLDLSKMINNIIPGQS